MNIFACLIYVVKNVSSEVNKISDFIFIAIMLSSSEVSPSGHDESDYTGCDGGDKDVLAPGAILLVP